MEQEGIRMYAADVVNKVQEEFPQSIQTNTFIPRLMFTVKRFLEEDHEPLDTIISQKDVLIKTPYETGDVYEILYQNKIGPISIGYVYPRFNSDNPAIRIYLQYFGGEPKIVELKFTELESIMFHNQEFCNIILNLLSANPDLLREPEKYGILDLVSGVLT